MRRVCSRLLGVLAVVLVVQSCATSPDEHVKKGDDYVAKSMLREAVIEYRAGLQAAPNRGDIRLKLGDVYLKLQEPAQALGEYVRAADLLPDDSKAQVKAGSLLLVAGRFEDAKTRADKALLLDPKDAEAQILLGNALSGLKDFDGAIKEFQEALVLNPSEDRAYRNMAVLQMAKGNLAEADAAFRKAVEVAPTSVPARLAMAGFQWSSGKAAEAEQTLKDALALDPANIQANRALGAFYIASNRAAEAEPFFQAIAKNLNTPAASIALADYYLIAKRPEDARNVLRGLLSNPDAYRDAMTRLAAIDAGLGLRAAAQEKIREVLQKYPKDMNARLFSARLLAIDGKRDESLAMAQSIVTDEPTAPAAPGAYELIGTIYASLDRPEDAIKAYNEVVKRQPRPLNAYIALAKLYRTKGDLDKAQSFLKDALGLEPKYPIARAELVRTLLVQGKTAQAREELTGLQKDYPNAPAVLNLMAAQQFAEGKIDAARAAYSKIAAAQPNDLEAFAGLVSIDLATKRVKEAVARVEAGLKSLPPSGNLFVLAARTYLAAGDTAKAEELLKKAIETDPSRLEGYSLLGLLYVRLNRVEAAEQSFREIVTRNPSSVPANTMLGMLYDAQSKTADAEKQYKQVLALDPEAPVAANNLAWIYLASNRNMPEALQLARTAERRLPEEPNVADTLGWIYYREGQFGDAIRHLEISVKNDPNTPVNQYHLGMAYASWGESEKARKALTKALSYKVAFDGADQARKTLEDLPK